MLHYTLTDHDRDLIEARKRAYWAQPGIGEEYHALALSDDPFVRAKNLVELSLIHRSLAGRRILDAGAGTGRFAIPLRAAGLDVTACDISREMLRIARRQAVRAGHTLRAASADINRLPFRDESFDTVVSITVLRHFPSWRGLAQSCMRLVRPGGRLVFDLASGEQAAYGESLGVPELSLVERLKAAEDFQAAATVPNISAFAAENGWTLVAAQAHDLLTDNRLVEYFIGADWPGLREELAARLRPKAALMAYEWFSRTVLSALSPALTPSVWVVIEKSADGGPVAPPPEPIRTWDDVLAGGAESLDPDLAASDEVRALAAFARAELAPRIPTALAHWRFEHS